jgi:hypothetical protein
MKRDIQGTHQKALQINLDPSQYGTFAEIGAGQEVARWFFRVGGAAGTIAKTISAYDMTVSDAIYGPCERYVARARLRSMLDYEYGLLLERLQSQRGHNTRFFVFADTVRARGYQSEGESHGWMGIRFQSEPQGPPSHIIIHVRMLEKENLQQQEALGIIGVNLIHGALYLHKDPDMVVSSLLDDLTTERVEVDMIKFSGPAFQAVDNRLMSLRLVEKGLTHAAMFTADGEVTQASEVLYKKPVLVERGNFRPVTKLTLDLIECGCAQFTKEPGVRGKDIVVLMEMTMKNLFAEGQIDPKDFLDRADVLGALGQTVLISNFGQFHRLAGFLSRYTREMIGIPMGIPSLQQIFDEKLHAGLEGGILESFGRLFKNDLKLYIYPYQDVQTGRLITVDNLEVAPRLRHLYAYLREGNSIQGIEGYNPEYLPIFSRDVLASIAAGDGSWREMVPEQVVKMIVERRMFGYQPREAEVVAGE